MKRAQRWWRHCALAGAAGGLALAPLLRAAGPQSPAEPAILAAGAVLLAVLRPGRGPAATVVWSCLVVLVAGVAGFALGGMRLAALDAGALRAEPGARLELSGHLASTPRPGRGGFEADLQTARGRVAVRAPSLDRYAVGEGIRVRGRLRSAEPWRAGSLARRGAAMVLEAERIAPTGAARGGLAGRLDRVRGRAEGALSRGMPDQEAALARGFVLGQDEAIEPRLREDFRRSGLSHLLAVSGQNVVLLCLLAWPLLALAGLTLRARLIALLFLIAVYVPVTGAGPSIQRAGLMGAAGLVAALASRPASGWYALLLAAALTLAINPRAAGDIGWQLSFAAVVGIFLWTRRLAALLDGGAPRTSPRRALAEGAAMTAAATVATAPLLVHHFDAVPVSSLAANLLALPAVAPAMWLGMLAGMAGQLPALPVEPLNWLNSLCLAYISQVAHWLGSPSWAQLELELRSPPAVGGAYLALFGLAELALRAAGRRAGLGMRGAGQGSAPPRPRRRRRLAVAVAVALVLAAAPAIGVGGEGGTATAPERLEVRVLDVGQGDSILLDPPRGEPILIDAGPAEAEVAERLAELGVRSLEAVVITHDQSDHAGGLPRLLRSVRPSRVVVGTGSRSLAALAAAAGAERISLAEGGELRSGELRLTALWPPRELAGAPVEDPNARSLVLLAEWRHFSILLAADAEAELVPLDPGPVDVLKVAHHGSEDPGLEALLERTAPKLGVISVGSNPYGHPAPETLQDLREHGVPATRTDRSGEIVIEADERRWWVP